MGDNLRIKPDERLRLNMRETVTIPLCEYNRLIAAEARLSMLICCSDEYGRIDHAVLNVIRELNARERGTDFIKEEPEC